MGDSLPEVTVGRNPGNTLRVNNPSISRRHARFVLQGSEVVLHDLDSSNGSYVNGNRIRSQALVDGDRVRIGEFPLDFVDEADSATSEVGPEVLESMLQNKKQTHMGGFHAPQEAEFGFQQMSSPPPPPSYMEEIVPEPVSDFGFSQPGSSQEGGFSFGGQPQPPQPPEGGFMFGQPAQPVQDGAFAFGAGENYPSSLDMDAGKPYTPTDWDDEPLELEPDLAEDSEDEIHENLFEPPSEAELGGELSSANTSNAPPEQIAASFARLGAPMDSTVEQSVDAFEMLRNAQSQDQSELQNQLQEVLKERDELVEMLQNRASDGNAASQLQIERLRKERDRLTEERRKLMQQLNDVRRQVEEGPSIEEHRAVLGQVSGLEESLRASNEELIQTQQSASSLEGRLAELQAELADALRQNETLHSQLGNASDLGAQLSSVQQHANNLQAQHIEAQQTIVGLNERLDASIEEINLLDSELQAREQRIAELTDDRAELQNMVDQREAQNDALAEQLSELRGQYEHIQSQLENTRAELAARPVAEDLQSLVAELGELKTQLTSITGERDSLRTAKADLELALSDSRTTMDALNARYSTIGSEFDALRKERDDLKEERVAFARETDYLQTERRRMVEELEDLRKKVKAFDKEAKRKKQIFEELGTDLRKLVTENNQLQDRIKELEGRLSTAPSAERLLDVERTLAETQRQLSEMESDNSDLTRELGKFAEERETLTAERDALRDELEGLQEGELQELRNKLEAAQAQGESVAPLQEELEQVRAEIEAQKVAHESALEAMRQELEAAQSAAEGAAEAASLRKKLDEAEATLAEMILAKDKLEDEIKKLKKK
jgi:chromosome segregation ATPase